jgi:hypothetical protein
MLLQMVDFVAALCIEKCTILQLLTLKEEKTKGIVHIKMLKIFCCSHVMTDVLQKEIYGP